MTTARMGNSRAASVLTILLLGALPDRLAAQDGGETRAEEYVKQREARAEHLEPYRAGWLERTLLGIEKAEGPSIAQQNLWGFYPRIQGIAQGSRNALGVRFWQPDIDGSRISASGSAFVTVNKYQYYDLNVGRIAHGPEGGFPERTVKSDDVFELGHVYVRRGSERFTLSGFVRYEDYTQLSYYGLGDDSSPDDRTDYRTRDATVGASVGWRFGPLGLIGRGGFLQTKLLPGTSEDVPPTQDVFDDETAPGLSVAPDYWWASAQAVWDRRDVPFNPKRGAFLGVQLARYDDRNGDAFAFSRFGLDARGYVSLGSPQRVLALRALYGNQNADAGAQVPFYLQEFLGGSHTLRGFDSFRFRGTDSILLQAEYRWEPASALEMALFVDAGQVAASSSDFRLSDLRTDVGVGFRVKTWQAVLFRVDVAWSEETARLLVRFSQAW